MRLQRNIWVAAASVGCFCLLEALDLGSSVARALTISPVLVELAPERRVVSITLSNPGDRAVSFQTQTLAWTQPEGVDHYEETDELMVVPPIAEIRAGGSQVFRVMMRIPPSSKEHAYRLIFEDVTELAAPETSADGASIGMRVSHSLPVFVAARGKPRPQLRLGPCASTVPALSSNTGCVRLDNDGDRYAQIKSVVIDGANWHKDLNAGTRVLSGAWHQWTFDLPPASATPLHATADTSGGPVTFDWPIAAH